MNSIAIRQATLTDLDALTALFDAYLQFYGRVSDVRAARTFLRDRIERAESVIFIASQGDESIGFTQLYPGFSSLSLGRCFMLNDLFVRPDCRKKGVGAGLIHAAIDHARAVGAIGLSLSTARSNTTAQSLYEALGWQRDDHFLYYDFAVHE
jgi:GNAT superfamily N-acetyltransferase